MLKRLLLASTALVVVTTPAAADPITLGTIAISGFNAVFGAGAIVGSTVIVGSFTIAAAVGTAITAGLAIGLSLLSRPGRGSPIDPGAAKSTIDIAEAPARFVIGRAKVALVKFYGNSAGYDTYRLGGLSAGPIDAIEEYFLGGRSVVVEVDGTVSSPPFSKPGGSYINITTKPGDGTETASADLISAFPTHWTSDHRVRGIAQALVKYTSPGVTTSKFMKIRPSGAWPELQVLLRGRLLYDPRDDSTGWSDNGILACLHVYLLFPGVSLAGCNLDIISDEADKADATVTTRTGTEPRSRVWGVFEGTGIGRSDLLAQVMKSAGAEMLNLADGKIAFRLIDDNREPEVHIVQDHIRKCVSKSGKDSVERVNTCRLKYYSPERNYELAEIDLIIDPDDPSRVPLAWSIAQDEIDNVGEQLFNIDLPFCPSPAQAQRIARRLFEEERGERFQIVTDRDGLYAFSCKTISFEVDYTDGPVTLEIEPVEYDFLGQATINGFAQPALTAWNPAVHEALPPPTVPETDFAAEIAAPSAATANAVVTYPGGALETRIGYPDTGAGMTVEAVYRTYTSGLPNAWASMSEYRSPTGTSFAHVPSSLAGQNIDVRLRHFNAAEDGSTWSVLYNVTPAAINTAPAVPGFTKVERLDVNEVDFTITAPADLHVSYLIFAWSGDVPSSGSETISCRPGEVFTRTKAVDTAVGFDQTATFTARAYSSNGTASSLVTLTVTIPAI